MPRHLTCAAFLVLVALSSRPAGAQTTPPAKACTRSEYRQFDFWIGEWDVMLPNGKRAGVNRIEPILGGCALRESWSGVGGNHGTSYNAWDATRGRWHQTWVDNQGTLLVIEGAFADGRMVLQGETVDTAGRKQLQRITWEQSSPGQVRQLWESSDDGGSTWTTAFDGRYTKR
jgi:hypothetical protein